MDVRVQFAVGRAGSALCDEMITGPDESYRLCVCVCVCIYEREREREREKTSTIRWPRPYLGYCATEKEMGRGGSERRRRKYDQERRH